MPGCEKGGIMFQTIFDGLLQGKGIRREVPPSPIFPRITWNGKQHGQNEQAPERCSHFHLVHVQNLNSLERESYVSTSRINPDRSRCVMSSTT